MDEEEENDGGGGGSVAEQLSVARALDSPEHQTEENQNQRKGNVDSEVEVGARERAKG